MKKAFMASLCWYGIHGGGLTLEDDKMVYRAQKILPESHRRIEIPYAGIAALRPYRAAAVFPAVEVRLKNGGTHCFVVLNRRRFWRTLQCTPAREAALV